MHSASKAPEQHPQKQRKTSFWKTLPGAVTALATLITALTGLMVALCQMHILICTQPSPSPDNTHTSAAAGGIATNGLKATANGILYEVLSANLKPYSANESMLVLTVRMTCGDNGENFTNDVFRLKADGDSLPPENHLSNKWLDPHSASHEDIEFVLSNNAKDVSLEVGRPRPGRTADIALSDQLAKLRKSGN
jgi:hypothetical protein